MADNSSTCAVCQASVEELTAQGMCHICYQRSLRKCPGCKVTMLNDDPLCKDCTGRLKYPCRSPQCLARCEVDFCESCKKKRAVTWQTRKDHEKDMLGFQKQFDSIQEDMKGLKIARAASDKKLGELSNAMVDMKTSLGSVAGEASQQVIAALTPLLKAGGGKGGGPMQGHTTPDTLCA